MPRRDKIAAAKCLTERKVHAKKPLLKINKQMMKYLIKNKRLKICGLACLILLILVAGSRAARAQTVQGMETINAPIEATVKPAAAIAGQKVKITGATEFDGKRFDLKITVTPPSGADPVTLAGKINQTGKFEIPFDKTSAPGKYTVKVIAPDGKGTATAKFEVFAAAAVFARPVDSTAKMLQTANSAANQAADMIKTLPPSASQEQMLAKVGEIKKHLAKYPAEVDRLRKSLAKLAEIPEKLPATLPAFDNLTAELDRQTAETEQSEANLREQLAKSRKAGALCEDLDTANEIFAAISFMLNLNQEIFSTVKNFLNDKGTPRLMAEAFTASKLPINDDNKFFLTETVKTAAGIFAGGGLAAVSPVGWFLTGIGLLNDIAQYQTAKVFGEYCERFEGPVDGTFGIKFYEGQQPFWSYIITLKGKMAVRYAKPKGSGDAVIVKGHIEGNATNFDIKENFIVMNPNLRRFVVARKTFAPPHVPYAEDAGALARMAAPGYFRIPVEGEMIGSKIKLKLLPATSDFSKLYKGKALYVFFSPPLPYMTVVDLPFQNAAFIFSRSMRDAPEFEVATSADGKSRTLERDFPRDHKRENGDFEASFRLSVKMCNPSCINNKVFEQ